MTCQPLPDTETAFFELLKVRRAALLAAVRIELDQAGSVPQIYFPVVYDIKYLMKFCTNLHGGLNKLAETLEVERVGPQHQVLLA